jgi:alkylhydroperoxidase family enzyme
VNFLAEVEPPPGFFDDDLAELGFIMNASRLWAYQPRWQEQIFGILGSIVREHGLTFRHRGILVAACASTLGDSYCSVAWGTKLAAATDPDLAAAVLRGDDLGLTPAEHALASWARQVTQDPNATTLADVDDLRTAGWTDPQIFGITVFTALRIAFSTVNDALGAHPDANYRTLAPAQVLSAITFGRPIEPD